VIGWSYDAAGNLLNDGTSTGGSASAPATSDALNRLTSQGGTSYGYNHLHARPTLPAIADPPWQQRRRDAPPGRISATARGTSPTRWARCVSPSTTSVLTIVTFLLMTSSTAIGCKIQLF
jgi:hypothetical protein